MNALNFNNVEKLVDVLTSKSSFNLSNSIKLALEFSIEFGKLVESGKIKFNGDITDLISEYVLECGKRNEKIDVMSFYNTQKLKNCNDEPNLYSFNREINAKLNDINNRNVTFLYIVVIDNRKGTPKVINFLKPIAKIAIINNEIMYILKTGLPDCRKYTHVRVSDLDNAIFVDKDLVYFIYDDREKFKDALTEISRLY